MKIIKIILSAIILLPAQQIISGQYLPTFEALENMLQQERIFTRDLKIASLITGTIAVGTTIWALVERAKKNKLSLDLKNSRTDMSILEQQSKTSIARLEQIVKNYQNDSIQLNQDEQVLTKIGEFVKLKDTNYRKEIEAINSLGNSNSNTYLESLINLLRSQIGSKNNIENILQVFNQDLALITANKKQLELKISQWTNNPKRLSLLPHATNLLPHLNNLELILQALTSTLNEQKAFIRLSNAVDVKQSEFAAELKLANTAIANEEFYLGAIDKLVKTSSSDVRFQFPYIAYVQKLKAEIASVNFLLNSSPIEDKIEMQIKYKAAARRLMDCLINIYDDVTLSPIYLHEKRIKPEHDRKEEALKVEQREKEARLKADLEEQQSRVENERRLAESRLQEERNRAAQLQNEKRQLEAEKEKLSVQQQQIVLELKKINDGTNVANAVSANNAQWESRLARVNSDLDRVNQTVTQLNSEIRNIRVDNQAKLDKINNYLNTLTHSLTQVPFNPNTVNGLQQYLNSLKMHASNVSAIVNNKQTVYVPAVVIPAATNTDYDVVKPAKVEPAG